MAGSFETLSEEIDKAAGQYPDDIDKQIEIALQCPCVGMYADMCIFLLGCRSTCKFYMTSEDMMNGPCKDSFVDSFTCFMKSDHPEVKGYDCVSHFERFQECLSSHPEHIEEFLSGDKENDNPEGSQI